MTRASELLRAWRVGRDLTLLQTSRQLDMDPSTLSKLERGERKPGRAMALKLERDTGIDPAWWDEPAAEELERGLAEDGVGVAEGA